jgi:hypothetical protein
MLSFSTYGGKIFFVVWTLLLADQQMRVVELVVSFKIILEKCKTEQCEIRDGVSTA